MILHYVTENQTFSHFFVKQNTVSKSDIAVCNRNRHTATGNRMSHGITQCHLPLGSGGFPTFTSAEAGTRFSDPDKAELT